MGCSFRRRERRAMIGLSVIGKKSIADELDVRETRRAKLNAQIGGNRHSDVWTSRRGETQILELADFQLACDRHVTMVGCDG